MCIGRPMQIIHSDGLNALCRDHQGQQWIDMSLIGPTAATSWVLVHLGTARALLSHQQAQQISAALAGIEMIMLGQDLDIEQHFSDLINNLPSDQSPPF